MRARGEGDDRGNWLNGITDPVNMSLSKLRETVKTGKPGVLQFMGLQKARYNLVTGQQQCQEKEMQVRKSQHNDLTNRKGEQEKFLVSKNNG